jgi:hypothetical protein
VEKKMNSGAGNGRKLFCSGALNVHHNALWNLDFYVAALQETRLGSGIEKFGNFALSNSGSESKKHEFGCGFYVRGNF